MVIVVAAGLLGYIVFETREDFARLRAVMGIAIFVGIGWLISGIKYKFDKFN